MGSILAYFGFFFVALTGLALTSQTTGGLIVFVFLVGFAASALSPAIQTRLMDVAGDSQTLAVAVNHASLNLGNGLGALLGGVTIAAGFGYVSPTWVGLILCGPGIALVVASLLLQRSCREPALVAAWAVGRAAVRAGTVAVPGSVRAGQVRLQQDAILDRPLAQPDLRADVDSGDTVLLPDAFQVRLRGLL